MIRLLSLLLLFAAVLWLPGAVFSANEPTTSSVSQITVQRTECYGACPVDEVTFHSNGTATYSGISGNTPRRGLFRGALPAEQFSNLVNFLDTQNFFEMRPIIESRTSVTTDTPDFLVSAVRDGQLYDVSFVWGGNQILAEKFERTLFGIAETVQWQREDDASTSGVRGTMQRSLTPRESALFRNNKPPVESLRMAFAPVWMESFERPGEIVFTRCDSAGCFTFFAPPGRYSLLTSRFDVSEERRDYNAPRYSAEQQKVTVEKEKFVTPVINFQEYDSPLVAK